MGKFHDIDVEATLKATERKSIYLSVAADSDKLLRFLPTVNDDGNLFALNINHFGLEEDDRGVAYGCLNEHGEGNCPLCKVAYFLMDSEEKGHEKVGKTIKPSNNWYAQVLDGRSVPVKDKEGSVVLNKNGAPVSEIKWFGPYLMRFSKTGADSVSAILRAQVRAGEKFITDPKNGKAVVFTRTGTGYDTKYTAITAGDPVNLDKVFPTWKEDAFDNLLEKMEIKLRSSQQMIAAAVAAHSLDWETILAEAGVA